MKNAIETAIKKLTAKAEKAEKACDALQYSQAALNLAHAFAEMEIIRRNALC
jgi:hypothetical protein